MLILQKKPYHNKAYLLMISKHFKLKNLDIVYPLT